MSGIGRMISIGAVAAVFASSSGCSFEGRTKFRSNLHPSDIRLKYYPSLGRLAGCLSIKLDNNSKIADVLSGSDYSCQVEMLVSASEPADCFEEEGNSECVSTRQSIYKAYTQAERATIKRVSQSSYDNMSDKEVVGAICGTFTVEFREALPDGITADRGCTDDWFPKQPYTGVLVGSDPTPR